MSNIGPEELSTPPQTSLARDRELVLKRPGNINYAAEHGSFAGSRLVTFGGLQTSGLETDDAVAFAQQVKDAGVTTAAEAMNLYFKHRSNLTVVAVIPDSDLIHCIFTNFMEGEELDDFKFVTEKIQSEMDKLREERNKKKDEAAKAKQEKEQDDKALIELGRKAREHKLVEKLRDMTEKYEEVRKLVAKYEKAEKKGGKK